MANTSSETAAVDIEAADSNMVDDKGPSLKGRFIRENARGLVLLKISLN